MLTNPRDAFRGQLKSPNSEIGDRGHSKSLKVVPVDRLCMGS